MEHPTLYDTQCRRRVNYRGRRRRVWGFDYYRLVVYLVPPFWSLSVFAERVTAEELRRGELR